MYTELNHIGMFDFLLPFAAIAVSFYVRSQRWYKVVDGRFDVIQLVRVEDQHVKLQYALGKLTPIVVRLLIFQDFNNLSRLNF